VWGRGGRGQPVLKLVNSGVGAVGRRENGGGRRTSGQRGRRYGQSEGGEHGVATVLRGGGGWKGSGMGGGKSRSGIGGEWTAGGRVPDSLRPHQSPGITITS